MQRDTNKDTKQHQRSNVYQNEIDVQALKRNGQMLATSLKKTLNNYYACSWNLFALNTVLTLPVRGAVTCLAGCGRLVSCVGCDIPCLAGWQKQDFSGGSHSVLTVINGLVWWFQEKKCVWYIFLSRYFVQMRLSQLRHDDCIQKSSRRINRIEK